MPGGRIKLPDLSAITSRPPLLIGIVVVVLIALVAVPVLRRDKDRPTPAKDAETVIELLDAKIASRSDTETTEDETRIDAERRELRNIFANQTYLKELKEARGRRTVPVLWIVGTDGNERWMPESADIVRYLEATYG